MAKNTKWIIAVLAIFVLFNLQGIIPKEAVADVDGQICIEDADCPCWGLYDIDAFPENTIIPGQEAAWGIGVSSCDEGFCDTTYCVDVEPVQDWFEDKPWDWLRENPLVLLALVAVLIGAFMLPK